jgi:acyl carrier protein
MKPEAAEVHAVVKAAIVDLRADLDLPAFGEFGEEQVLMGGESDFDSMALVHLIADLEGRLREQFGLDWILADERALSRRRSPFRTVGSLCEFILETTPETS